VAVVVEPGQTLVLRLEELLAEVVQGLAQLAFPELQIRVAAVAAQR
jgi:hypothetical protein